MGVLRTMCIELRQMTVQSCPCVQVFSHQFLALVEPTHPSLKVRIGYCLLYRDIMYNYGDLPSLSCPMELYFGNIN